MSNNWGATFCIGCEGGDTSPVMAWLLPLKVSGRAIHWTIVVRTHRRVSRSRTSLLHFSSRDATVAHGCLMA